MVNQQKDTSAVRSDTTSPGGAQPVQGQSGKVGGTDAARAPGWPAPATRAGLRPPEPHTSSPAKAG
jgi:hypothetical protein